MRDERLLDSIAKTRYLEKLKLLGLDKKDDPYDPINSHNFVDDMTRWPAVEYGNIFCYYIQRPGVLQSSNCYSGKLRCFQLFSEWIWPLSTTSNPCIVMAYVNPSQNAPEKSPCTKLDGETITLHCTCMAR